MTSMLYNKRFLYHIFTSTKYPKKCCAKKIFAISKTSHLFLSIFESKSNELGLTGKFVAF